MAEVINQLKQTVVKLKTAVATKDEELKKCNEENAKLKAQLLETEGARLKLANRTVELESKLSATVSQLGIAKGEEYRPGTAGAGNRRLLSVVG